MDDGWTNKQTENNVALKHPYHEGKSYSKFGLIPFNGLNDHKGPEDRKYTSMEYDTATGKALFSSEKMLVSFLLFVCVEVLRPSQPNGVMSSAVSLPNHTFTGQA